MREWMKALAVPMGSPAGGSGGGGRPPGNTGYEYFRFSHSLRTIRRRGNSARHLLRTSAFPRQHRQSSSDSKPLRRYRHRHLSICYMSCSTPITLNEVTLTVPSAQTVGRPHMLSKISFRQQQASKGECDTVEACRSYSLECTGRPT